MYRAILIAYQNIIVWKELHVMLKANCDYKAIPITYPNNSVIIL